MTARQGQVLAFMRSYRQAKGYDPRLQDIAQALGVRSVGTVHKHVQRLRRDGHVATAPWAPRVLREHIGELGKLAGQPEVVLSPGYVRRLVDDLRVLVEDLEGK